MSVKRYLNYRVSNQAFDDALAPVLIPEKVFNELNTEGAYTFIEHLAAPVEGTGGIYTPEFFESFVGKIKNRPIPGDKFGHRDLPVSDFYTVGGSVQRNDAGGADVYLKIIVPATGYDGATNAGLVRDIKIGNAEFSIVTEPEIENRDGKQYFIASLSGERNDRVDEGAMAHELLANKNEKENEVMIDPETLAAIKTAVKEAVAEAGAANGKKRSNDEAEQVLETLKKDLGLPPEAPASEVVKEVETLEKEVEEVSESVAEVEANRLCGTEVLKNGQKNPAREYFVKNCKGKRGKALKNAVVELQNDIILKTLLGNIATGVELNAPESLWG
jgi:hypothetical protein